MPYIVQHKASGQWLLLQRVSNGDRWSAPLWSMQRSKAIRFDSQDDALEAIGTVYMSAFAPFLIFEVEEGDAS